MLGICASSSKLKENCRCHKESRIHPNASGRHKKQIGGSRIDITETDNTKIVRKNGLEPI